MGQHTPSGDPPPPDDEILRTLEVRLWQLDEAASLDSMRGLHKRVAVLLEGMASKLTSNPSREQVAAIAGVLRQLSESFRALAHVAPVDVDLGLERDSACQCDIPHATPEGCARYKRLLPGRG